jgi:hypothetical protein
MLPSGDRQDIFGVVSTQSDRYLKGAQGHAFRFVPLTITGRIIQMEQTSTVHYRESTDRSG